MNYYCSLDIRLATGSFSEIEKSTLVMHQKILETLYSERLLRIGPRSTTPIFLKGLEGNIELSLDSIFNDEIFSSKRGIYICLFDFSENAYQEIRDPLLIKLSEKLKITCDKKICKKFVLILPGDKELPEKSSGKDAFINVFNKITNTKKRNRDVEITIIDGNGVPEVFSNNNDSLRYLKENTSFQSEIVRNQIKQLFSDRKLNGAKYALERKCIERLGHFHSVDRFEQSVCRNISYTLVDCQKEILFELNRLWMKHNIDSNLLIYDSKTLEEFTRAIKAFAKQPKINLDVARIEELNNEEFCLKNKNKKVVLIVDVIDTHHTLKSHIQKLEHAKLDVCKFLICALNKNNSTEYNMDEYSVLSLVGVPPVDNISSLDCTQCKDLNLDIMDDATDNYFRIRAYDYFTMVLESGLKPENKYEKPIGFRNYELIPYYKKILERHGAWIAYKFNQFMRHNNIVDDVIILHPAETDSENITSHLVRIRNNKPTIIKIPRKYLDEAGTSMIKWRKILNKNIKVKKEENNWIEQINIAENQGISSIIIDIFKGSGSTTRAIKTLLDYKGIKCSGLYCLVDYNPEENYFHDLKLPVHSLYRWKFPRARKWRTK